MAIQKTEFSPSFKAGYVIKGKYADIKKFEKVFVDAFQKTVEKPVAINGKTYSMPVTEIRDKKNFYLFNDTFVTDVKTTKNEVARLFVTNESVQPLIAYRNLKKPYANFDRSFASSVSETFDKAAKKSNEALQSLINSTKMKLSGVFNKEEAAKVAIIDAKDALKAAEENRFDFVNGKIG